MGVFDNNTETKIIDLENYLYVDDRDLDWAGFIAWDGNKLDSYKAPQLQSEFKLSEIHRNYYPTDHRIQRCVEPKGNWTRRFDYEVKHDSINFTYKGARKTLSMYDMLKPEFHNTFRICNCIPYGLVRVGIAKLHILPESIPDGPFCRNDEWKEFLKGISDQISHNVEAAVNDNYKIEFTINDCDFFYDLNKFCLRCTFKLLSIDGEPVYWWGHNPRYAREKLAFNLRPNDVELMYKFYMDMPDFLSLKVKYK